MANQINAIAKLAKLRQLPIGWDYGQGGPISGHTYAAARVLISALAGLGADDFDVVPGAGDCAVIIGYKGDKSAEISCLPNGIYELLHEEGEEDGVIEAGLSLEGVLCALEDHGWQSPKFYASCTQNATFHVSGDTVVMLSRTPRTVAGYQWSVQNVSPRPGRIRVITSKGSTKNESAETRQSSGEYQSMPWALALA